MKLRSYASSYQYAIFSLSSDWWAGHAGGHSGGPNWPGESHILLPAIWRRAAGGQCVPWDFCTCGKQDWALNSALQYVSSPLRRHARVIPSGGHPSDLEGLLLPGEFLLLPAASQAEKRRRRQALPSALHPRYSEWGKCKSACSAEMKAAL